LSDNDLKAAMAALPRQFREFVYYADVAGFRCMEIAEIMHIPLGTVMSQLHDGRRQFRKLLADGVGRVGPETLPRDGVMPCLKFSLQRSA